MKDEIKNEELKKEMLALDIERAELGKKVGKAITAIGLFLFLVVLGVGTQQAIINITSDRVAKVTQLELRAAKAKKDLAEAEKAAKAAVEMSQEVAAKSQEIESWLTAKREELPKLAAEIKAAEEKLAAVESEFELANSQLASVKEAIVGEEERLTEVKNTSVTATVPVVASEPTETLTTALVAKMKGWLK